MPRDQRNVHKVGRDVHVGQPLACPICNPEGFHRAPAVPSVNPNEGVRNWCEKHWAPVREGVLARTHNGLLASAHLIQAVMADDRFFEKAQAYALPGEKPDTDDINRALRATAPQCCFLGDAAVAHIIASAKLEDPS